MKLGFKKNITRNLLNLPGWRTNRKIVVIESDDWGAIRMASVKAYKHFANNGFPVNACPYNSNDALESNSDLELLFETLSSIKDSNGKPAIITANNIVANPDFERISLSGFQQYFYEPFTETLKHYPEHHLVESLYAEGIEKQLFKPQFHGREHLNVARWVKSLQEGDKATRMAFDQSMFSVHSEKKPLYLNEFMDALDGGSAVELDSKSDIITDGLNIFKNIWGFHSKSFIAPCYIWSSKLESSLAANGVEYIQGMVNQMEPIAAPGFTYKKIYHYQGQRNKLGQHYLIRNAFFEPATNPNFDWIDDCLNRIEIAFKWKKPAIISAHRLNFIGYLNPENRGKNLTLFIQLLNKIKKNWPQIEFMSSDQLGDLIKYK